jgi:hypothetical protein
VLGGVPCYIVVVGNTEDQTASAPLSFKLPSASAKLTEQVPSGYLDKIKAANFPAGETVEAHECDSTANTSNLYSPDAVSCCCGVSREDQRMPGSASHSLAKCRLVCSTRRS